MDNIDAEVKLPPGYKPGVCNAIRKDNRNCSGAPVTGTYRCKFHPLDKYPASYAEAPAPAADKPGLRIAAVLDAVPLNEPDFKISPDLQREAESEFIITEEAEKKAGEKSPQALSPAAEGMEERFVYDGDLDDYVKRLVPITTTPAFVNDPNVHHDETELGQAYYSGDNAAFDYRWINDNPVRSHTDRRHGFVPVKKALDNRFRVEGGVVKFGDLILARRPKEITEQRAREMVRTHERVTGEVNSFQQEETRGVETFGSITSDGGDQGDYGARIAAGRNVDSRTADNRLRQDERLPPARGGKSYSFPNNPIGRDLVAERHGSVGG